MSGDVEKRVSKLEQEQTTVAVTLAKIEVVLEKLVVIDDLVKKVDRHSYNWGIVKWVIGPVGGVSLLALLLRVFGVL